MRYLEAKNIRHVDSGEFPLVDRERLVGRAYLDSAATAQKPDSVVRAVSSFYRSGYASVHRGIHRLSEEATAAFESARLALGRFIHAREAECEIILCSGATQAINMAAYAWGDKHVKPGDEIVLTTMEHHSNLVPWQLLARRTGANLVEWKPESDGTLSLSVLKRLVNARTKLLSMTHVSNVLGTVNDIQGAATIAHKTGALVLVDGAQALGHMPVDVRELECDLYAGSGHKMFGPTGTGFLYGRLDVLETFDPFLGGGDMIEEVRFEESSYAGLPARLEAGTPNVAGIIGLGAAVSWMEEKGMERVREHDREIIDLALVHMERLSGIEIYGPLDSAVRSGLVSFNIEGFHAHDVGSILSELGVAVRSGHLCAQPLMRHLGISSCVRASFALYNDASDVDRLVRGLREAIQFFNTR